MIPGNLGPAVSFLVSWILLGTEHSVQDETGQKKIGNGYLKPSPVEDHEEGGVTAGTEGNISVRSET